MLETLGERSWYVLLDIANHRPHRTRLITPPSFNMFASKPAQQKLAADTMELDVPSSTTFSTSKLSAGATAATAAQSQSKISAVAVCQPKENMRSSEMPGKNHTVRQPPRQILMVMIIGDPSPRPSTPSIASLNVPAPIIVCRVT